MKRVSVDTIMSWQPCYTRRWVQARFGRRKTLGARTIATHPDVEAQDRFWVLWRMLDVHQQRTLACDCVGLQVRACRARGGEMPEELTAAIRAARAHVRLGSSTRQLGTAYDRVQSLIRRRGCSLWVYDLALNVRDCVGDPEFLEDAVEDSMFDRMWLQHGEDGENARRAWAEQEYSRINDRCVQLILGS